LARNRGSWGCDSFPRATQGLHALMEASTNRIAGGFIAAFALLALNAIVSYTTLGNLVAANHLVANTEQSLHLLVELRASLIDAETGQRGYIISGEERYLDSYANSRPTINAKLDELVRLTSDDTERAARLSSLAPLISKRLDNLSEGIAARKQQGAMGAISLAQESEGKALMDRIRHIVSELQNREEVLLATRNAEAEFNASVTSVTFVVATFLNVCLLGVICFMVIRSSVSNRKASAAEHQLNAKLEESLGELGGRAPAGGHIY
jgi:methyl-accepting chemotaxis protein